jgi:hypothetical protein
MTSMRACRAFLGERHFAAPEGIITPTSLLRSNGLRGMSTVPLGRVCALARVPARVHHIDGLRARQLYSVWSMCSVALAVSRWKRLTWR